MRGSLQNKIIAVILVGILFSSIAIGGLGIYSFSVELDKSVVSNMNLTCQEKAEELNNILGRIEQSAEVMAVLTTNYLTDIDSLQDLEYREHYLDHMQAAAYNIASKTNGAIGIYLRLNPEIAGPTEGFYWLADGVRGELKIVENTNIEQYSTSDTEYVGWYYEPIAAGQAIWMDPYENQNIHKTIVSFAMPVYEGGELLGVVGMDIDWSYITDKVDEIQLYETGYAFLVDEDYDIVYNKDFEPGTNIASFSEDLSHLTKEELVSNDHVHEVYSLGQHKAVVFSELTNGKFMAVIAPKDEINADFHALVMRIIIIGVITIIAFILITMHMAKSIIQPLQELDKAAQDIAKGNLDVELKITSNDEVGNLAKTLSETAHQLRFKIDYINNLAFSDKLTGIKNNTAYLQDVAYLKNDIQERKANFSLFVLDANGLKYINDNYGHELGNELIIKITQMASEVFGADHLYRIGGDEFAVIAHNMPAHACEAYVERFGQLVKRQKGKIWVNAAIGYATYDEHRDSTFESVFNRADEDMYEKKVRMKEDGLTSKYIE